MCGYCPPLQLPLSQPSAPGPQLSFGPTERYSISVPQIPKFWACSLLEHSSSSSCTSRICVASCRKPSTTPHLNKEVAFLLCSRGSVQMSPLSQLLLCCSISSCSYPFAIYITGFIKTAAPFLVGLHVQNLSLTYHERPGNISYNNKVSFSFFLIVRGQDIIAAEYFSCVGLKLFTDRRTMDLHSFKDIIFFQNLVFILKQQSPSKLNTDLKLRWPVVGRYQLTKALGTLHLSTKNALIPSLQSLPRWKVT